SVSRGARRAAPVAGDPSPPIARTATATPSAPATTTPRATAAATRRRRRNVALTPRTAPVAAGPRSRRGPFPPALPALVEVDDERHAGEAVALAQPVLDEVRVVAGHAAAAVDRDREARRPLA